jgi:signal transduction histidine kinase
VMLVARRRLLKQAAQRRMAEAEFAAILAERNRLAREIHDTLAQGLGAISLHLGLVKNQLGTSAPEGIRKHLDLAYEVARASLADARSAIFNMRSQVLEQGDLPSALRGVLRQMTDGTSVAANFETSGHPRRLPPVTENAILRIGQEAITNAERHGQASRIDVRLDFGDKQVRLTVRDNGCGFDADHPPPSAGGFGLVGMRERAAQLRGELTIRSRPGAGAEIIFAAPVPSETTAPS